MGTSESLQRWGWSSYFEALWNEGERENAVPARVIAQQRKLLRIAGTFGECWAAAGAKLVIVLNKADTCVDTSVKTAQIERIALGTEVCVVSARTGQGMESLEKFLMQGQTIVLLGSSGVGKSTIANRLLGEMQQNVQ